MFFLYKDEDNITKMQGVSILLSIGIIGFFTYMLSFGIQNIANKKAQNPNNLLQGCMYYVNKSKDRYDRDILLVSINKKEYRDIDIIPNSTLGFPAHYKEFIMENKSLCHKVSYIKLNLVILNKIYVYHYDDK